MTKKLFFLIISSVMLFSTCKKDKVEEETGPVKFKFTAGPFFDSRPNKEKSSTIPFAYLFLFDSNGKVVKEQPVHENRVVEITSSQEGAFSVGIFNIDWLGYYHLNIFQDIPSGFVMKSLTEPSYTDTRGNFGIVKNIENIQSIDSIKWYKYSRPFKLEYLEKNDYTINYQSSDSPLMIYTDRKILPKYLFGQLDQTTKNLIFEYDKAISGSEKYFNLDREGRWRLTIHAKNDKKYSIFSALNNLLYSNSVKKFKRIEFTFPDTTFNKYLCHVQNYENEFYFSTDKLDNQDIIAPNFDIKANYLPNGTITCSSSDFARVMVNKISFDKVDHLYCNVYTNIKNPESVPSLLPSFPKTLTNVYGIKASKITTGTLFGTQVIASKNDTVDLNTYLNYLFGDQEFEWLYEMGVSRVQTKY
jgi:hypothetical protein